MPACHRLALLLALGLHAAGALAAVNPSATIALTGLADTDPPSFSGASWVDGVTTPVSPLAGVYSTYANPFGLRQAGVDLAMLGAAVPSPGAAAVPVIGVARAAGDLMTGQMGLTMGTQRQEVTRAGGGVVSAFSAGSAWVEMGEGFDLLMPYAGGAPDPVHVRLQFTLSGEVIDAVNEGSVGLRATLRINHVAEGNAGVLEQVLTYGNGTVNDVITLDATLVAPECSALHGLCGYYFSVYGALEGFGQVAIGAGLYSAVGAGDQINFDNGGSLRLLVPAGAVATTVVTGQPVGWVTAVPEPTMAALWAAGLLGLIWLRRPRR